MKLPKYMTSKEAAEKWNCHERTVRKWCAAGKIRGAYQHGRPWFIPREAKKPDE